MGEITTEALRPFDFAHGRRRPIHAVLCLPIQPAMVYSMRQNFCSEERNRV